MDEETRQIQNLHRRLDRIEQEWAQRYEDVSYQVSNLSRTAVVDREAAAAERSEIRARQVSMRLKVRKVMAFAGMFAIATTCAFAATLSSKTLELWGFDGERVANFLNFAATGLFGLAATLYAGKPGETLSNWLNKD